MASPKLLPEVIEALKGWPRDHALDIPAFYASGVTSKAGMVLHVDAAGEFALGVGTLKVMPLFAIQASTSEDVADVEAPDPAVDKRAYVPINSNGKGAALVATGAYELIVDQYSGTADDFLPNVALTSPLVGATAGLLVPGTMHTDMIVGLVSRGLIANGHGGTGLAFWPCPVFPT